MKKETEKKLDEQNGVKAEKSPKCEKSDKKELQAAEEALKQAKSDLEKAEKAANEAEEKLAATTDKMMRIAAEYDNFRKRASKEKEDAYTDAYADAVKTLLPVMDNLERAQEFSNDEGTALILKQLSECFDKLGVKEIPALDLPFDPNFHNAVMIDEEEGKEPNTVTAVLQKGYTLREKVIRFAMVKVSK